MQISQCGAWNTAAVGQCQQTKLMCDWIAQSQLEEFIIKLIISGLFSPHEGSTADATSRSEDSVAKTSGIIPGKSRFDQNLMSSTSLWDLFQMCLPQLSKTACNAQTNK